jgi:hypothetical protein
MANISTVKGGITFVNMTPRLIKEFVYFTNTYLGSDNIDCGTTFNQDYEEHINSISTDIDTIEEEVELCFIGSGKWNYDFNLRMFGIWITNAVYSEKVKTSDQELVRWFKFLNDLNTSNKINDSQIYISYVEEESGCGFICEVEGRFYLSEADVNKHPNLIEGQTLVLEYEQTSEDDFEYTRENLINICGYSESDFEDDEDEDD